MLTRSVAATAALAILTAAPALADEHTGGGSGTVGQSGNDQVAMPKAWTKDTVQTTPETFVPASSTRPVPAIYGTVTAPARWNGRASSPQPRDNRTGTITAPAFVDPHAPTVTTVDGERVGLPDGTNPRMTVPVGVDPAQPTASPTQAAAAPQPGAPAPAPVPQISAEQVAAMAMKQLRLQPPQIGSAPCHDTADCKGAVGLPVWLWTQPWAAQSATATAGAYSVTATAVPTASTWDMGNGDHITCVSAGTPFDPSMGMRQSPDCGYPRYTKRGTYNLSASLRYRVTFTGAYTGQQDALSAPTTVPITIAEYQVVIDHIGA